MSQTKRIEVAEVLNHQKNVEQAFATVAAIKKAMQEQQRIIADAEAAVPMPPDRRQEREDILAEMALGDGRDNRLRELDAKIAVEKSAYDKSIAGAGPVIERAKAVLNGMGRKLEEAETSAAALANEGEQLLRAFLRAEAERTAEVYISHALQAKESFFKLCSLDRLIAKKRGKSILCVNSERMFLSLFNLPQFDSLKNNAGHGVLFDAEFAAYGNSFDDAAQQEESRLTALGIRL